MKYGKQAFKIIVRVDDFSAWVRLAWRKHTQMQESGFVYLKRKENSDCWVYSCFTYKYTYSINNSRVVLLSFSPPFCLFEKPKKKRKKKKNFLLEWFASVLLLLSRLYMVSWLLVYISLNRILFPVEFHCVLFFSSFLLCFNQLKVVSCFTCPTFLQVLYYLIISKLFFLCPNDPYW